MEPVELDFIYSGNTQTEGAKIIKTTEQIAAAHAEATKMVERHTATVTELKKDLVELGTSYKQATSKQQKSEILTEIELTKKNIIDETAAIKVLKSEIASMNKMPKASVMPDAAQVGKTAVGYSSLNFSTQQLVRELPAATMGLNMFFLAISNNIPVLTDGIKRARAENEALKASGSSGVPVWKQLVSSLFSWQSAMMVGITVLSMYGKDIIAFVSKLFTGKDAIDKTAESQKALNKVFSDFTGNAARKIEDVVKMGIEIETYGNKAENSRAIIDNFNKTFNTHFTTIEQVRAAYPKLSEAAITAAVKIQAANSLIEKSAQAVLKKQEADTALSTYSAKQVKEQEAQLNKLVSISKKYGADMNELTTKLVSGEGFGSLGVTGFISGFATKVEKEDINKLSELSNFFANEDNLWFAKYLSQQRKYGKLMALENKEIGKLLAGVEYKDYSPTTTPTTPDKKTPTVFGKTPDAQVGDLLLSINKGINDKLTKQRKDFITKNQQAQKMGSEEELKELQKNREDVERIILQMGDERTKIEKAYNEEIKKARIDNRFDVIEQLEKERDEKISAVSRGLIEESDLYKYATTDKIKLTKEMNDKLIALVKERIQATKDLSQADKDKLIEKVDKSDAGKSSNALDGLIKSYGALKKAKEDAAAAAEIGDVEGAAKAAENIGELQGSLEQYGKAIIGYFDQAASGVIGIMDQLGAFTAEEKQMAEDVVSTVSSAGTLAVGIATGDIGSIISGAVGTISGLLKIFDEKGRDIAKQQKKLVADVDKLKDAYDRLERAVSKAFSTGAAKLQEEEIRNIQAQIQANNAWIEQERRKKTKKQDQEAIAAKQKENEANQNLIKDKKDAIIESLTGSSVMSAIDQFASAYADAFTSGEDAALKSAEVVKNILKTALIEKLKNDLQPGITALMNMISNAMADGYLSESEKAQIYAQNEQNTQTATKNQKMFDELGLTDSTTTKASGIKGDVAKISEETGSALTGQLVAMRLNVAAILLNSKSSVDLMSQQLASLEEIKSNTAFCRKLERMDETLYYIKLNGVKVL